MTENEAIEIIKSHCKDCKDNIGIECIANGEEGKCWEVKHRAIMSMRKLQEYRAIGTVDECREAREKQRAKKPVMKPFYKDMKEEYLCCPTCGDILTDRIPLDNKDFYFHCLNCGQKFKWEE